ncbi:MAG: tetratricopeptide repeat protein [Gemmatimonadota bacterium]
MGWVPGIAGVVLVGALCAPLLAQQPATAPGDSLSKGLQAERRGYFADAARLLDAALAQRPADLAALMALDRVLPSLNRRAEMVPAVVRALAVDSTNIGILSVAVRAFASAGMVDSAKKYSRRWTAVTPDTENVYREWVMAAMDVRDHAQAKAALEFARREMHRPAAMAPEYAQLLQEEGDLNGSVREWMTAIHESPGYRNPAVMLLGQATVVQRPVIREALTREGSPESRRLLGLLQVHWGESVAGTAMVRSALPPGKDDALTLLRLVLEELRGRDDRSALLARATVLELVAERQAGRDVIKSRMDAARAYADAGAEKDARRLLAQVAADSGAPAGMATTASSTLLGVLIAEGKPAEAEKMLADLGSALDLDERDHQARRIAMAWARLGNLDRAQAVVANDSSIAGYDLRGRLRLFAGDLVGAGQLLQAAGPYDEERETAVERVTLLVLLQSAGPDSLPQLGSALLALERGDSATAVAGLTQVAEKLKPTGAAEARLLAGRLALSIRDTARAARLLQAADVAEAPATAAAARLDLIRLAMVTGKTAEAEKLLEQLILDYPESAVIPEARRLRDQLRGGVPGGGR